MYAFQKWLLNGVGGKSLLLRVPLFSLLGYTSYRDTEKGSWFIQEFVEVFHEQANEEHVMDMLAEVCTGYVLELSVFWIQIWELFSKGIIFCILYIKRISNEAVYQN